MAEIELYSREYCLTLRYPRSVSVDCRGDACSSPCFGGDEPVTWMFCKVGMNSSLHRGVVTGKYNVFPGFLFDKFFHNVTWIF